MAKGKYAARAANREAARDNQLLAEKLAEITRLQARIADLEQTLEAERRHLGSEIIRRADTLSAEQIRNARNECTEQLDTYAENNRTIAEALARYFNEQGTIPDFWSDGILPLLIPDLTERGQYIEINLAGTPGHAFNRQDRRTDGHAFQRMMRRKERDAVQTRSGRAKATSRRGSNKLTIYENTD